MGKEFSLCFKKWIFSSSQSFVFLTVKLLVIPSCSCVLESYNSGICCLLGLKENNFLFAYLRYTANESGVTKKDMSLEDVDGLCSASSPSDVEVSLFKQRAEEEDLPNCSC